MDRHASAKAGESMKRFSVGETVTTRVNRNFDRRIYDNDIRHRDCWTLYDLGYFGTGAYEMRGTSMSW